MQKIFDSSGLVRFFVSFESLWEDWKTVGIGDQEGSLDAFQCLGVLQVFFLLLNLWVKSEMGVQESDRVCFVLFFKQFGFSMVLGVVGNDDIDDWVRVLSDFS